MKHHPSDLSRKLLRVLGLTLAMVVAVGTSTARAQENVLESARFDLVIAAFNVLGNFLAEFQFYDARLNDADMNNIRSKVCNPLNSISRNELDTLAMALSTSLQVSSENPATAAQQIARNGDKFTEFLKAERAAFRRDEFELREPAQALALQLMIAHRGHIARDGIPTETVEDLPSTLTMGKMLLCEDEHSPANNESSASWWSWVWAGTKFVGGLVVAGVDVTPHVPPQYKRLSVSLGLRAVRNGFSDLVTLIRRTDERDH
ncbi:MAG: hypothetical protein OXI15_25115 [Chromatiales bacterium]|nr:hypothetical protein [Chromatiales bacterium]